MMVKKAVIRADTKKTPFATRNISLSSELRCAIEIHSQFACIKIEGARRNVKNNYARLEMNSPVKLEISNVLKTFMNFLHSNYPIYIFITAHGIDNKAIEFATIDWP